MSNRLEISSVNKGLFNRNVLARYVTEEHKEIARKIKHHFEHSEHQNPLKLSAHQLNGLSESDTIDYYIKPILKFLGYTYREKLQDTAKKYPDIWLLSEEPEETRAQYLQRHNLTILEAKKYKIDLDVGARDEVPPDQILGYIKTNQSFNPLKKWGILSNGYMWRLYSADGTDKYIEFDIDHALEDMEELEIFCLIFHPKSFKIGRSRSDLLSSLKAESLNSWVSITGEIKDRGNDVLLNLVNGFYDSGVPLEKAKQASYQLLFRLLYTLFIESKHLIPKGSLKYFDKSLRVLLQDVYQTSVEEFEVSKRISDLFKIYDTGGNILPRKFGGEHFENCRTFKMKNKWLRTALELLTVFSDEGSEIKFFDYSSLNVELIGNVYEGTLSLAFKVQGGKVVIEKPKRKKGTEAHATGTTYTPPNVVKYLVGETFPQKLNAVPLVCDPACGSGHFLVQALRHLSAAIDFSVTKSATLQSHKREIALKALFGTDINGLAASLTRLMLVLETSEKGKPAADFRKNIRYFNALLTRWSESPKWIKSFNNKRLSKAKGFDVVIGNPPYVRADEPGQAENRKSIVESGQYKCLEKKWDLFIPFIELAFGLTRSKKGKVAFVVSDGITYAPYAEACVKMLNESKSVKLVSHFEGRFEGWAFPATCFVIDHKKSTDCGERRLHEGNSIDKIVNTTSSANPFLHPAKEKTAATLSSWKGLRVGDLFYISKGMVLNSDEKQDKVKFKKEDLISQRSDSTHPLRYVDNEDIGFGKLLQRRPARYTEYGPRLRAPAYASRPTFNELHVGTRILLSRSKLGKAATLATDQIIVSDNTLVLKKWDRLIGVDNRAIKTKSKLSWDLKDLALPDFLFERVVMEELSSFVSENLLLGIFLSDFFVSWISDDKRHKHVIVPDVISEMPFPLTLDRYSGQVPSYDITFQENLKTIESYPLKSAQPQISFHIENIVESMRSSTSGFELKVSILNKLVEMFFRPILQADGAEQFSGQEMLREILDSNVASHKEVVERPTASKRRKLPSGQSKQVTR